jgi:hypothetical protein
MWHFCKVYVQPYLHNSFTCGTFRKYFHAPPLKHLVGLRGLEACVFFKAQTDILENHCLWIVDQASSNSPCVQERYLSLLTQIQATICSRMGWGQRLGFSL